MESDGIQSFRVIVPGKMFTRRTSRLIVNLFYVFIVLSSGFNHIAGGLVLTALCFVLLHLYCIPPISKTKLQSIFSRSQQTTRSEEGKKKSGVILHRGGVLDTPENTLEGVRLAHENGAQGVEVDLEFTADGVGILLHDSTLDRTTDGTGRVGDMKFEDVRKLDAAAKHPCRQQTGPMQIPTLEECVKECLKLDLMIYIDCKSKPQQTAGLLMTLFKKYPDLYSKAIVCSFYPQLVYTIRQRDPNMMTGLTHRGNLLALNTDGTQRNKEKWKQIVTPVLDVILEWAHYNWFWYICGNSFFIIHKDDLSRSNWKFWNSLDISVIPWTVNNPTEKEFFQKIIGCPIMTDGVNSKE